MAIHFHRWLKVRNAVRRQIRLEQKTIYCCFFWSCDVEQKESCRLCVAKRRKWQQTWSTRTYAHTQRYNWTELAATVWFMDRRLNLIAFIYTFYYFCCSIKNVSSSHCHSFILSSRLLCHAFRRFSVLMLVLASSFVWSMFIRIWIWCVYALNWYRFKITHIVENICCCCCCCCLLHLLSVMFAFSLSLCIHHKPSRLSDPKNAEQWISIFLSIVRFIFSHLVSLFLPSIWSSLFILLLLLLLRILMMQCIQHAVACAHFLSIIFVNLNMNNAAARCWTPFSIQFNAVTFFWVRNESNFLCLVASGSWFSVSLLFDSLSPDWMRYNGFWCGEHHKNCHVSKSYFISAKINCYAHNGVVSAL